MDLLYFWRGDNYRRDTLGSDIFGLEQNTPTLLQAKEGETVWAFTRNLKDRYVLAARIVVKRGGPSGPDAQYGDYRIVADQAKSIFFDVEAGRDFAPVIRNDLGIRAEANPMGRSFQGPAAVRELSPEQSQVIGRFAATLPLLDGPASAGSDWSPQENEIIAENYLNLLLANQRGEHINKAENNRLLQRLLPGRSRGSIEYKLQNVSAVLDKLDRPWLPGYKPASNIQTSLIDAVTKLLSANREEPIPSRTPAVSTTTFEKAPDLRAPSDRDRERVRRASKANYALQDEKNRALGIKGEEWVVEFERQRLTSAGRADLAKKVVHIAAEQGDGLGYDVKSYDTDDGSPLYIEVKTTNGGYRSSFLISSAEIEAAKELGKAYRLYRVYYLSTGPKVYQLRSPLDASCALKPTVYQASFG